MNNCDLCGGEIWKPDTRCLDCALKEKEGDRPMTHPIVEKVAAALREAQNPFNVDPTFHRDAQAAIDAVFYHLMEPSDKVRHEAWYISTDDISEEQILAAHKHLLTQARKEIEDE